MEQGKPFSASHSPLVDFDAVCQKVRAAIEPARAHAISLHDQTGELLWLSESSMGPDEHNAVREAIDSFSKGGSPVHVVDLGDARSALLLRAVNGRRALVGAVMIVMDTRMIQQDERGAVKMMTPRLQRALNEFAGMRPDIEPQPSIAPIGVTPVKPPAPRSGAPLTARRAPPELKAAELKGVDVGMSTRAPRAARPPGPGTPPLPAAARRPGASRPPPAAAPTAASAPAAPTAPAARPAKPAAMPQGAATPSASLPAAPSSSSRSPASGIPTLTAEPVTVRTEPSEPVALRRQPSPIELELAEAAALVTSPLRTAAAPASPRAAAPAPAPAAPRIRPTAAPAPAPAPPEHAPAQEAAAAPDAAGRPDRRRGISPEIDRLHAALRRSPISLYVQHLVPLAKGSQLRRYEVLLRSGADDAPNAAPQAMLRAAVENGLGSMIDRRVITELIGWLVHHPDAWQASPALFSVNLTATALHDEHFIKFVELCLAKSALPTATIAFELEVPTAAKLGPRAAEVAQALHRLGCPMVLDDFALRTECFELLRLPGVRYVKLDPEITARMRTDKLAQAAITAVVQMARVLGMHTVAKRTESPAEQEWLTALGVDFVQSHAISPPTLIDSLSRAPNGR